MTRKRQDIGLCIVRGAARGASSYFVLYGLRPDG
jgi:hypothetical protein